ncbi:cation:proton antiporter [bacterium]|nr:cation:proton antiporter [bacterium]
MSHIPILYELVLVIGVSLITVGVGRYLRIPTLVGLLVAGMVVGPGMLGLVEDRASIETIAQVGVVFLLFTIGLKFSLRELAEMRGLVLGAGGLQVGLTTLLVALVAGATGLPWPTAALLGMLVAMTSTTIMLRILEERGEVHAPHGRLALAISLFQDLSVIPMMLLLPLLAGERAPLLSGLLAILRTLLFVAFLLLCARYFYPWLLARVVQTRSREMFVFTTLFFSLGTAYVAGLSGISLALGAFLAGIMISESEYSHQIVSEIAPLRDVFSSLFFVSVGMLVEPAQWGEHPLQLVVLSAGIVVFKTLVVLLVALLFGFGTRAGTLAALANAQIGEFSFILAHAGVALGLLSPQLYGPVLSATLITMALSPFLYPLGPVLAARLQPLAWLEPRLFQPRGRLRRLESAQGETTAGWEAHHDHVIVVGFSVNGRNVARALRQLAVPYVVLEMNPRTVLAEKDKGEPILYGDATQTAVQRHVGVERARELVVSSADPTANRQIVSTARRLNPDLFLLVRTRFVSEVDQLHQLGADEVIVEEFETSLELTARVMAAYGVPNHRIAHELDGLRRERYERLRPGGRTPPSTTLRALLSEGELDEITLLAESPGVGKSLRSLDLRQATGALVVGLERAGDLSTNPSPDLILEAGDSLFLWGRPAHLLSARRALLGK